MSRHSCTPFLSLHRAITIFLGCLPKPAKPQFSPGSTTDVFCLLITVAACPQNRDLLAEGAMALSWVAFFGGWRVGISDSFPV